MPRSMDSISPRDAVASQGTISSFNVPVAKVLGNDETHAELRAEGIDAVENARGI